MQVKSKTWNQAECHPYLICYHCLFLAVHTSSFSFFFFIDFSGYLLNFQSLHICLAFCTHLSSCSSVLRIRALFPCLACLIPLFWLKFSHALLTLATSLWCTNFLIVLFPFLSLSKFSFLWIVCSLPHSDFSFSVLYYVLITCLTFSSSFCLLSYICLLYFFNNHLYFHSLGPAILHH